MKYPGPKAYTMEQKITHTSPCMSFEWLHQPIWQGKPRQEHDFEDKQDTEED
jgi:hypothetical protein